MSKKVSKPMHISVPISKVDEEQRMVWGYATVEEVDAHGEIIGYEASKKAFTSWIGNIREQHNPDRAVGKKMEVQFDDAKKGVWLGAYISESADGENAWTKIKEGVLQGFSIGGRIAQWDTVKVDGEDHLMVTDYSLSEVSVVDNPACPSALLEMVKSVDGHLEHVENMKKQNGQPAPWFERAYKFTPSARVIVKSSSNYNKDSMAKSDNTITKNIWSAGMLVDLGRQLADYVWMANWDGKDVTNLENALEEIKAVAQSELNEPESWPQPMADAVELAMQTLDLTKEKLEEKVMAKDTKKDVTGDETRDAEGNVVVTAEENGRPADDTQERASENADDKKTEAKDEKPADDEKVTETPKDDDKKSDDEGDDEGKGDASDTKKPKKSDDASDLSKSTETSDLLKSIGSIVKDTVKEAVEPLENRIKAIEGQPADSKVKGSYVDVEKTEQVKDEGDKAQSRMQEIVTKAEDAFANPEKYSVSERMQLAKEMRKLQRSVDPVSQRQNAEIRATIR